jgi:hypothetical protein
MADEMRLPEELAAFEALLAARTLPASRLDRDQVMYRAGWAACEAQASPPPSKGWEQPSTGNPQLPERRAVVTCEAMRGGIPSRRRTFAWSCASAALAAALAVAVTLGLSQAERKEIAEVELTGGETPRLAVDASAASATTIDDRTDGSSMPSLLNNLDRLLDASAYGRRPTLAGPWLAMQRLDLRQIDDRHAHVANDVEATPATSTIRNLQQELLPAASAPRVVWPWERTTSGDSI